MTAIGIDLGTTNCCVAVCRGGTIDVLQQSTDKRTIPSYISFSQKEIIFGDTAKFRLSKNVQNTIYDVKRMIGRNLSDTAVKNYIDKWGFTVITEGGRLKVSINRGNGTELYTPEELSGLLLKELKKKAEDGVGNDVNRAVITVPSYFNDAQRQATIDAGKIAGFEEVKLLNEPTAAAIAYTHKNSSDVEKTIFIFDLGGGTFDVSIVRYKDKTIDVLAIDGNIELGGNDIDNILVDYLKEKYSLNLTRRTNVTRLQQLCEAAKKQLSDSLLAYVELCEMSDNDEDITISRDIFNEINKKIYDETIKIIKRCMVRAKIRITDIDDVILVGGSTKICKISEILENLFKKPPKLNINPDEAVAMGAAIVASQWNNDPEFVELEFNDICPYSLGVEADEELLMSIIIEKFTRLPAKCTKNYHPLKDDQVETRFALFSGENSHTKDNNYLGEIIVSGYKVGLRKSVNFEVTFIIDKNGVLTASVLDCTTGTSKGITVKLDKGRFSEYELFEKANQIEELYQRHK